MNQSLFALISRAGRMSLDELRARSSVEPTALARDIVSMIREGVVALSPNPETSGDLNPPDLDPVFKELQGLDEYSQQNFVVTDDNYDKVSRALTVALIDEPVAYSLMISPTSRGFRFTV